MTRVPKVCCRDSLSVAELDGGEADRGGGSRAPESSCQTALTMSEMQVVSSLAQVMEHASHLVMRGGGTPYSNEKLTTQLYANTPGVTKIPGRHLSPPKMAKAKWNSDVRCSWPPSSPQRSGSGAAKRPPDSKFKDVGVMSAFPAITAFELSRKVEVLEQELDVHVGNERQLLSVNEQLRKRLEVCLRELSDAGMVNVQLENLNDEAEKILQLLRHLSERNAVLEKENALAQAKLQIDATLNKFKASKMLRGGCDDRDVGVCDAECQTICSCQTSWQVDNRKKRRDRKRWLKDEEESNSSQPRSKSLSPTQMRHSEALPAQSHLTKPDVRFL